MHRRFSHRTAQIFFITCLLCTGILLSACGYKLAADTPSILGDGTKTLKIKEVSNPTLEAWLPASVRSGLRDAINARHLAVWVDQGPADYEIKIDIKGYTSRETMSSRTDVAMLYDNRLAINATIYDGATNKVIWQSGEISYADRSEDRGRENSADDLIAQIMSRLTEKLRNTF